MDIYIKLAPEGQNYKYRVSNSLGGGIATQTEAGVTGYILQMIDAARELGEQMKIVPELITVGEDTRIQKAVGGAIKRHNLLTNLNNFFTGKW